MGGQFELESLANLHWNGWPPWIRISGQFAIGIGGHFGLEYALKAFSGTDLRSNRYWKGLVGFMDHYYPDLALQMKKGSVEQGKIILPATPAEAVRAK